MNCLGLDIGGANLKAADSSGWSRTMPFALWRDPAGLAAALRELISTAPPAQRWAITMTGELCDCFSTKSDGVRHILAAIQAVGKNHDIRVYQADGRFATASDVMNAPALAAASNWRALAEMATRYFVGQTGLLIDIGSTTTDIIPIVVGRIAARGRTDTQRLTEHELVYSGVGRTPVCAIVRDLPLGGQRCPVAAELFATAADAYLLLGQIAEEPAAIWTADGRPLTRECSGQRLARQVGGDAGDFSPEELVGMAKSIREAQIDQLIEAMKMVKNRGDIALEQFVVSGAGEFLAREALKRWAPGIPILRLSDTVGMGLSSCAPAYAVALLALREP